MIAMTVDQALAFVDEWKVKADALALQRDHTSDPLFVLATELRRLRAVPAGMDAAVKAGLIASWAVENGNLTRIATVREIISAAQPHLTAELRRELDEARRLIRAGYVLAMRVLHSDLMLDGEAIAARDEFIAIGIADMRDAAMAESGQSPRAVALEGR